MYSDFTVYGYTKYSHMVLMCLYPPFANTDNNSNYTALRYRSTMNYTFDYTLPSISSYMLKTCLIL